MGQARWSSVLGFASISLFIFFCGARPLHRWIRSDDGMNRLRNVLRCYAVRNANVAYCQSMNFVAALLLIALKGDEEKVV